MQPKIFGKKANGKDLQKIASSHNFKNGVFLNPIATSMSVDPLKVMKDYFKRSKADGKPKVEVPFTPLNSKNFTQKPSSLLQVRWLGHASSIIELDGIRILTDPVFSERVSPFGFMGPKRMHPSPLPLSEIPKVDIVIISHNHYDHLDYDFILAIKHQPIQFIVPLGVGAYLQHWGVSAHQIIELDWHDSFQYQSVSITATPARHFTGRGILDRNKSFWASFAIKGAAESIFFCGDSGFFNGFDEIGIHYGPFDITMIGIGAYNKQWQAIHTNPAEAIEAHHLLRGKHLLPIHWCTFDLAPHHWQEPIEWLLKEAEKRNTSLLIPVPGEEIWANKMDWKFWWR
jgi:L-ascorbate metabolism protein UlaG (beta-lactamase superfamily)